MRKFIDLAIWRFGDLAICQLAEKAGRIGKAGSFGDPSVILRSSFGDGKGKVYLTYSELKADLLICEFGNLLIILTFVANSYFTLKKWFYPLKFLGLCNTS